MTIVVVIYWEKSKDKNLYQQMKKMLNRKNKIIYYLKV